MVSADGRPAVEQGGTCHMLILDDCCTLHWYCARHNLCSCALRVLVKLCGEGSPVEIEQWESKKLFFGFAFLPHFAL